jgi:uncharacterized protein DUF6936
VYEPLREVPPAAGWGKGDVLVLFGELFGRGYANGIVDEARRAGMTVVGATVGRREPDGTLRPLTPDELSQAEANLGGRIVNLPLEAGFDLEPAAGGGPSPAEQLKAARPDAWQSFALDWALVESAREAGARRFDRNLAAFVAALEALVPSGANVLFVHTMAGGFPRARVYMPLLTRVFRGTGEKYLPSEGFWASDLGRLWAVSFDEVTGRTFERLVAATAPLREGGRRVRYVAYGYHGCEVLVRGAYTWQTYVPYLQGWAKLLLERCAAEAWARGVRCTVFNSPEIWSNSSAIFLGVEVALYPLLAALEKEAPGSAATETARARCAAALKPGATLEALLARAEAFLGDPARDAYRDFGTWPHHTQRDELEAMLAASADCLAMSADPKVPVVAELSPFVFQAVGRLMFDEAWEPSRPVRWLNHDVVAKRLGAGAGAAPRSA